LGLLALQASGEMVTPLPDAIPSAAADKQDFQIPDRVHLTGWLGTRITANEANRLVTLDPDRLLEGYRRRPGRQTWDCEHVGKWLHAATLAWVNTGDPVLRARLDHTVTELCQCQLEDGYLGTYLPAQRWTEWDVWAHKYNLLGLLTYMRYTGNRAPLETCRRMADLLCTTFGDGPGQRDIITSGAHTGMASTSVLEPMVLLHRLTGEPRYLAFCQYLVRAWEQPNGPHIVSRLLEIKRVDKVGNAKAYEMLSCLNGALELYRTTGEPRLLAACLNAWQDIVDHRLYVTGASSCHEYFRDDFDLPNNDNIGETCVTVTWLQLNAQLLRLTGGSAFRRATRECGAQPAARGSAAGRLGVGLLCPAGGHQALQRLPGRPLLPVQRPAWHRPAADVCVQHRPGRPRNQSLRGGHGEPDPARRHAGLGEG
jgi:hypothetical protein